MAVNLLRRRKTEETPAPEPQPQPRSHWPRIAWVRRSAEAEPKRRRRPPWRRRPYNPISVALWAASWAAVLILVLGMLLVSADANQANGFVHATMRTGEWLATPFRDVFHNANPDHQLYENWGLAAAVYFVAGRTLAWLLQWPR